MFTDKNLNHLKPGDTVKWFSKRKKDFKVGKIWRMSRYNDYSYLTVRETPDSGNIMLYRMDKIEKVEE